ncbi:hypothetical protein GCM10028803_30240 [Larkinella knui]|uniref:Heparinase n=1 Tax=Larkinella knui TaxID=2025310 RepID=A0A3P1CXI6_9BACT|nr:heparinase II/III family protein [Larkinella knui]RRB18051.1 heparinase [Larkinella knui]
MRILSALVVFLLAVGAVRAQVAALDTPRFLPAGLVLPEHPRLLLAKGEEKAILQKIRTNTTWAAVHAHILQQCDSLLPTRPVERVLYGVRLLDKSRTCLFRVFHLSYAWRTTRDRKYLQRAEQELLAVAAFSDWNPSHYLDVAEMTMGVAIGYDWLYPELSETSRTKIRTALLTKGVQTAFDPAFPHYRKWLTVTNNWNQVCNAGLSFGALALYEDAPELASRLINRSIASVAIAMKDYEPDGAFAEGYTYWGYGTTFNVLFLNALEKVFKTNFGLEKNRGFYKTADYLLHVVGPAGQSFNYSDATERSTLQPAMFWFAHQRNDPSLLWSERHFLTNPARLKQVSERLLPALMIWADTTRLDRIEAPKTTFWTGAGRNPVALMRTSWTDSSALFVGIKGGSPLVTHGHMDAGSFVMDADGVRWAMDFGFQDYTPLELKNVDLWDDRQHGQRWQIFRYNNFSHNTLTVNDSLQRVKGIARITRFSDQPHFRNAVVDLSSLYQGQLANARRGIALLKNTGVLIRDEVETGSAPATVRWSMLTAASVKMISNNQAELTRNGKKLTLFSPDGDIRIQTWPTTAPRAYDEPNPGTIRVGFDTRVPAHTKKAVQVFLIPGSVPTTNARQTSLPLQDWPGK